MVNIWQNRIETIWYIRTSFILNTHTSFKILWFSWRLHCCMQGLNFQYQFRRHGDEDANNFYFVMIASSSHCIMSNKQLCSNIHYLNSFFTGIHQITNCSINSLRGCKLLFDGLKLKIINGLGINFYFYLIFVILLAWWEEVRGSFKLQLLRNN